jgi:uncharacterized protein (TIGR00725 family)
MGPGEGAAEAECAAAERLGELIAGNGWVTLTGGRPAGVMDAALRGAKRRGGLTVGILPGAVATGASRAVDIPIVTGIGEARNIVNVLTSQVVCVCGTGAGTASEIALALKAGRPTILVSPTPESAAFWQSVGGASLHVAQTPEAAIAIARSVAGGELPDAPSR